MRTLRKILFYAGLAGCVLILALTISVFLFKDKIIKEFVREANKQLSTPVTVGKMDVSIWHRFPMLSIVMSDVYIEDSHPGKYPLLTADRISFELNLVDVWNDRYIVHGLTITNSETSLKINPKGENNYTISTGSGGKGGSVSFDLQNVLLESTVVHYDDHSAQQYHTFRSSKLKASIQTVKDIYNIIATGDITTEKIEVNGRPYLTGKAFQVNSKLVYDDIQKQLLISPSTLDLKQASFEVSGEYRWKEKNTINLKTVGRETDIQTLLSLMPEATARKFEKYKSKGDVYFSAVLKGEISSKKSPSLSIDFGFKNATLLHPEYQSRIEDASLTGSFASLEVLKTGTASLVLKDIRGRLNDEPFAANLIINNFDNPEVISDFKGRVDAGALLGFYPIPGVSDVSGAFMADVRFRGRIALLKKKATAQKVSTQGAIDLQHISFSYGSDKIRLDDLQGNLQFSNNDLALSNVTGRLGHSDFRLNGFFKNIITFLLFEDQPIGIETDLRSNFLDVDQLLALGFGKSDGGKDQHYEFEISKNINLNFNCDVRGLRYKRFHATDLKGDLLVKNQMAVSRQINFKAMGGNLTFSGIVDAQNNKAIDVVSTFRVSGIHVDSVFYVFENFDQDFIQDKHLRGRTTADVSLEMVLNQNLKLFSETLVGDITATIQGGELNDFEPMSKLKPYLNDQGLNRLRFSDLRNDIHIENKTIYIPQMEIRSNVTTIKVSGTHTFDQQIDYRIIAPLRNNKHVNMEEAREALEEDGSGQTKLFLKIVGTTDDYRVLYDTESVRKKIASDLKKEVQELKDAFRNKGTKKKKEVELAKDDYFDWDNY